MSESDKVERMAKWLCDNGINAEPLGSVWNCINFDSHQRFIGDIKTKEFYRKRARELLELMKE